jgi:hypothetical protein
MNIRGSLHVGQQIGVPSRVGGQIGVVWVVWIGGGCAQNRSMRSDTNSAIWARGGGSGSVVVKGPGSRGLRRVGSIFAFALDGAEPRARVVQGGG